jgi:hypothetical protein
MIKFSDYLNKIYEENRRRQVHNKKIQRIIDETKIKHPEYNSEQIQKSINFGFYIFDKDIKPKELLHVPSKEELEQKFNGKFETIEILGKIGETGTRIHKITINALKTPEGYIIWFAESHCGSQKYNIEYPSPVFPLESNDLSQVDCDKCLGIRVKGGKLENKPSQYKCESCGYTDKKSNFEYGNYVVKRYKCPSCGKTNIKKIEDPSKPEKRPKIDVLERPLTFHINFTNVYSETNKNKTYSNVKASNLNEAIEKLIKDEKRYGIENLEDIKLIRVYTFNDHILWKDGDPIENIPISKFKSKSQLRKEAKGQ